MFASLLCVKTCILSLILSFYDFKTIKFSLFTLILHQLLTYFIVQSVFRDWQAVGSDANSTYEMLFGAEVNTPETALRNKIRLDLHAAFASIQVWLFDAPTDLVSDLKKKLTIEKTSIHFKQQLRSLRSALATQLTQPVVFGGQVLSGRMLHGAVERMVDSLNSGQVVLPG